MFDKPESGIGNIRISDEAIAVIAANACREVKGVAGLAADTVGGIAEMIGVKQAGKGVKVEVGQHEVALDIKIIVEYNHDIPNVAWQAQERVRNAVEKMTGLNVVEVNITVQNVKITPAPKPQAESKKRVQ